MPNKFTTYRKPEKLEKFGCLSIIVWMIHEWEEVLDVWCSQGYLASYLPNNDVYGIDYNPDSLQVAQEFCKETACVNLNEMPLKEALFGGKKFDVIVFADVLEHIIHADDVLRFFKWLLKPNGKILISLPNVAYWRVRMDLLLWNFDYADYGILDKTHVYFYTFKSAKLLVDTAGLHDVSLVGATYRFGHVLRYLPFSCLRNLCSIQIVLTCKNGK